MDNKIGAFIARARKKKGLTQQELGDKLYVTDKAVSKWERGISLPDVSLLVKLADVLEVEVQDILEGCELSSKSENLEEKIAIIKEEMNQKQKKKTRVLILCISCLLFAMIFIVLRNMTLGYEIREVEYSHRGKTINLGINKTSFMLKNNDRSYSFKNFRNPNILESEIKRYLKSLKYSSCNETIYYYDEKGNFSIIDYKINNHVIYSTVTYEVVDGDYCKTLKQEEYANKLGGLNRYHVLNGASIDLSKDWNTHLEVAFIDGEVGDYEFMARMRILYYIKKSSTDVLVESLEESFGEYEIIDDKLYYRRTNITKSADNVKIPEVSVFKIENGNLILLENYISEYEENVILKLAK